MLQKLLDVPLALSAKFQLGDEVFIVQAIEKTECKGVVIEVKLSPIIQQWLYRIEVPEYTTVLRMERDVRLAK